MAEPNVTDSKDTVFQLRINRDVKNAAEDLFRQCGLTLTEAINLFIQQSLNSGGLPFEVKSAPRLSREEALAIVADIIRDAESTYSDSSKLPDASELWKDMKLDGD